MTRLTSTLRITVGSARGGPERVMRRGELPRVAGLDLRGRSGQRARLTRQDALAAVSPVWG